MVVAVLGGGDGCSGAGSVPDLGGDLNRLKGFEGRLGVVGVGSTGADAVEGRRFGRKNPSGPGSRLDWLEASLSDLSGVVPELRWDGGNHGLRGESRGKRAKQYPIVGF